MIEDSAQEHRARMQAMQAEQRAKVAARTIRNKGLLIVHTGDGKGKSTAAFGLALRAAGHGQRVALVQFTKGKWKTGEGVALARFPEIEHFVAGEGFTWDTQDRERDIASARHGWDITCGLLEAARRDPARWNLIILDELNITLRYDQLPIREVVETLAARPSHLHVVVTGRSAKPELTTVADTVTEMRCIRHAFENGVRAQRGIEF